MNINEEDVVNLGTETGSENYNIQTRVVDSSGAGVNAESRLDRAFPASDPLTELVWSSRDGLSVKCANTRTSDEKPVLLWNVGPSSKTWGSRDETVVEGDDMFVDKTALLEPLGLWLASHGGCDDRESNGKMEEAAETARNSSYSQLRKVPCIKDAAADAVHKKEASISTPDLVPTTKNSPAVEGSERESRMCLYKAKGKENASSDDEDDIRGSIRSCNSSGLLSRGIKRWGYIEDVIFTRKRLKKHIPLWSRSTFISKPDSSFMKWISNMGRGFSDSSRGDFASFPMPLACSVDVNAQNLHENFIASRDSAILNMGFQTMFQSLLNKDISILNTGEEKENALMVDDKTTQLCLSKQIMLCDRDVNSILVPNQAIDGIVPAESFDEGIKFAAEKTSVEIPVGTSDVPVKRKFFGSLWFTRFCTESPRSKKCQKIIRETTECSTSCPKLNPEGSDDSQANPKCSNNTKVSVDLKSTSKVCSVEKFLSSDAMAYVFARQLEAFRHIVPPENNAINDNQKVPQYDIVSAQSTVAPSEIFNAIRNLRLSRADILKWMNSDMSLSRLDGFFLRLRLKNLDQGLEGASYYVACISTGDGKESIGCSSNKSILVDVEGIRSSITSQYVSNHDFQEDEIKAWWCRALDRGCRVPSIDELNSKFNNRTSLGF